MALLINPAVSDPLVARLAAELTSVGLTVRRVEISSDADLDAVVTRAMATGAGAAIRVIAHSTGTEVWTSDTRARVLRRRAISAIPSEATLSVLAFRSVEFLRATLLDVPPPPVVIAPVPAARRQEGREEGRPEARQEGPPQGRIEPGEAEPSQSPSPPPPASAPVVAVASSRGPPLLAAGSSALGGQPFDVVAGPAWWLGSRDLAPALELALALRHRLGRRLSVGAMAMLPLSSRTVTTVEGSSALTLLFVGLSIELPLRVTHAMVLAAGATAGGIRAKSTGTDTLHGLGTSDAAWDPAASVSASAVFALTRWLAARAEVAAGIADRRIVIDHGRRDAATWGPGFGVAGVSLQASF